MVVDDEPRRIETDGYRMFGQGIEELDQIVAAFAAGGCRETGTAVESVVSQIGEHLDHELPGFAFGIGGDRTEIARDDACAKRIGHRHRFLGCGNTGIDVGRRAESSACRKRDRRDLEARIVQKLVNLPQGGLRHVARMQFRPRVNLDRLEAESRCLLYGFLQRQAGTCRLECEFNGYHGCSILICRWQRWLAIALGRRESMRSIREFVWNCARAASSVLNVPSTVAADDAEPSEVDARRNDGVEVFSCDFETDWDLNYDQWPDNWSRETAPGFPHYVDVRISKDDATHGEQCLKIDLNGGAVSVYSPPIPVGSLFSYILEGMLRTEGLERDEVYYSVTTYDAKANPLEVTETKHLREISEWTRFTIGPITPSNVETSYAIIGLHLSPTARPGLRGSVYFDDVWFARLPRMTLETSNPHNVYTDPSKVGVTCRVSGILDNDPIIKFEVVDAWGKVVSQAERHLESDKVATQPTQTTNAAGEVVKRPSGFAGYTTWHPELKDFGYYQIRVAMSGSADVVHQRKLSVVVVRPQGVPKTGEFGWTLPRGDDPVPLKSLESLLTHVGINWLKFPVWYSVEDTDRADQIVRFAERLGFNHIETVGLLHDPPKEIRHHFGNKETLLAADVFSTESEIWQPSLDPVMTRLSLKIRWWQLGLDEDISFLNYPDLPEKIEEIKENLYRFGQEVSLGFGWRWINEELPLEEPPWQFLSLSADPTLTSAEMQAYLEGSKDFKAQRWVTIRPLSRKKFPDDVRATDLIQRMIAAKIYGADRIFVPDPFDDDSGLMNTDGTPGKLLLPWRTTAMALAGAEYRGSMRLPGGSPNHVFTRPDGEAVVILWNDRPTTETIFVGTDVKIMDIRGGVTLPKLDEHRQVIPVGPTPVFITGASGPVMRMRMSFAFTTEQLPSVFGRVHHNAFRFENYFPLSTSGSVELFTPDVWRVAPRRTQFEMRGGQSVRKPVEILLPYEASSGRQEVRIDFDVNSDKNYKFSVYRHIDIGLGDVVVEADIRFNERGDLEVQQHLINHTDEELSFKCQLFVPGRRRLPSQVLDLGRGRDVRIYRLRNGSELVGKSLLLKVEEVDGQRILNYRITVPE